MYNSTITPAAVTLGGATGSGFGGIYYQCNSMTLNINWVTQSNTYQFTNSYTQTGSFMGTANNSVVTL